MDNLVKELILYLKTKDSLAAFLQRLDSAILANSTATDMQNLASYFTLKETTMIVNVIKSIQELRELKERLTKIEVFTIKIAFRPTAYYESTLIDQILKWAKEPCVAQILTERTLLGGAVIDFKGKYRDFSLKSGIDEWRRRKRISTF